jgi:transcriptional regulator with XRE-family HTH domain
MRSLALHSRLREARRARGWTQARAAARLGVTQAYLSMLESGARDAGPLARKLVRVYDLSPDVLPLYEVVAHNDTNLALELAALGYPGFSHLAARRPKMNPAVLLLAALGSENLELRVAEALPWLVVKYPEMPFDWLCRESCAHTLQNRLGFVVTLAQAAAPNPVLEAWLLKLADCKLAREDSFCRRLNDAERRWLRTHASPEARQWNLLSALRPSDLRHV